MKLLISVGKNQINGCWLMGSISIEKGCLLKKLQYFLNYEISSSILYLLSFHVYILIYVVSAAAIVFTPFMLYVLFKESKNGWLAAFVVIVLLPASIALILGTASGFGKIALLITLALFYFYCSLLRYTIHDWVEDINAKQKYRVEKFVRDQELKDFIDKLKD